MKPDAAQLRHRAEQYLREARHREACQAYAAVCAADPRDANAWARLGALQGMLGDLGAAETSTRKALALRPGLAGAHDNLGNLLQQRGQPEAAIESHRRAIALQPGSALAHLNLGNALRSIANYEAALQSYARAVQLAPSLHAARANLGATLLATGRIREAEAELRDVARLLPEDTGVQLNLARCLLKAGKLGDARALLDTFLVRRPGDGQGRFLLAETLFELGDYRQSADVLQRMLMSHPKTWQAWLLLGNVQYKLGELACALDAYRTARVVNGDCDEARAGVAATLEKQGNYEEAYREIEPLLDTPAESGAVIFTYARIAPALGRENDALGRLYRLLDAPTTDAETRTRAQYALGTAYDRLGDYEMAFTHFDIANASRRRPEQVAAASTQFQEVYSVFSNENMAAFPRVTARDVDKRVVFIVGMPRSGTTLVEQILAAHPAVFAGGERDDMPGIARECLPLLRDSVLSGRDVTATLHDAARRYLDAYRGTTPRHDLWSDKMPHNFLYLGLIELLLPAARVIHCVRDPRDVALSAFFQDFGMRHPYSNSLGDLGNACRQYQSLMLHWRAVSRLPILDVRYEDLVADLEKHARGIVAFCGLPWDPRCLGFHEVRRVVNSASYHQVRRPLYAASVARWKNYERHLVELQHALGQDTGK